MNEGKRPGSLTALAIINIIQVGLGLLGLPALVVVLLGLQSMRMRDLALIIVLILLTDVLLLLSGIGYLKQKKVLGRVIGNVYAICSIVVSIVSGLLFKPELGSAFDFGMVIGLTYPILTAVLINTTFKDDLTN